MTDDDLRTRAREAASSHLIGKADFLGDKFEAFVAGFLAHAAQQPTREVRRARERVSMWLDDDEDLRIPDTPWGRALYDDVRLLVDGGQS